MNRCPSKPDHGSHHGKWRSLFHSSLLVVMLAVSGCREPVRDPGDFVAKVGEVAISRETVEAGIRQRAQALSRQSDAEIRGTVLNELIESEALFQKAVAAGHSEDPELVARWRRLVVDRYREDQLARASEEAVSEAEVQAAYQADLARFTQPEKRRGEVIFLRLDQTALEARRSEVLQRASAIREAAIAGEFAQLARQSSEDQATRYRGGDMGWIEREGAYHRWGKEVEAALFALERVGDLSPVIQTDKGLFLLRLAEVKPAETKPLEAVRTGVEFEVRARHERRKEADFLRTARQGLAIEVNSAELNAIPVPRAEVASLNPPPIPGR